MKKLELDIREKKRILSLHKKMIQEQTAVSAQQPVGITPSQIAGDTTPSGPDPNNPDLLKIREYIKIGCLSNGEILANKDYTKYIYRKKSDNVTYDFYADNTYKASNGKSGQYNCNEAQEKFSAAEADFKTENIRSKWIPANETGATQEELNNPNMWESKVINGVKYYRSKVSSDIVGGSTENQKAIINSWTRSGFWKTANQLDASELQVAYKILASPKSDGIFNNDFYVYVKQDDINNVLNQNTCNKLITQFFDDWDKNIRKENSVFAAEKLKVERCATMFKNRKIFGIGKTDDNLKVLNGEARGGKTNSAPDRYSRFRLFNNVYKFDNK